MALPHAVACGTGHVLGPGVSTRTRVRRISPSVNIPIRWEHFPARILLLLLLVPLSLVLVLRVLVLRPGQICRILFTCRHFR